MTDKLSRINSAFKKDWLNNPRTEKLRTPREYEQELATKIYSFVNSSKYFLLSPEEYRVMIFSWAKEARKYIPEDTSKLEELPLINALVRLLYKLRREEFSLKNKDTYGLSEKYQAEISKLANIFGTQVPESDDYRDLTRDSSYRENDGESEDFEDLSVDESQERRESALINLGSLREYFENNPQATSLLDQLEDML